MKKSKLRPTPPITRYAIEKADGPTEKPGAVGLFCRTYGVEEAISRFIPGKVPLRQKETSRGTVRVFKNLSGEYFVTLNNKTVIVTADEAVLNEMYDGF